MMENSLTEKLLRIALEEDLGIGDVTSVLTIPNEAKGIGSIIAKEFMIVCGHSVAEQVFSFLDSAVTYQIMVADGQKAEPGMEIARVVGSLRGLLAAERTALNFLQRLSGISTKTFRIVQKVEPYGVKILDTRKTTPGWRELEKYAVRVGGGTNHRFGLYDAVLIKNNHVDGLQGDIARAISLCRESTPGGMKIEVEVRSQAELEAALTAKPDAVLLDNMTPEQLSRMVKLVRQNFTSAELELEASGGITEANIVQYAQSGVDSISLGELTHSVMAVDISLKVCCDFVD